MLSKEINSIISYLRKQKAPVPYGILSINVDNSFGTNIDESLEELERLHIIEKRKPGKKGFLYQLKTPVKQELLFIPLEFIDNPYAYFKHKAENKKEAEPQHVKLKVGQPKKFQIISKEKVTD